MIFHFRQLPLYNLFMLVFNQIHINKLFSLSKRYLATLLEKCLFHEIRIESIILYVLSRCQMACFAGEKLLYCFVLERCWGLQRRISVFKWFLGEIGFRFWILHGHLKPLGLVKCTICFIKKWWILLRLGAIDSLLIPFQLNSFPFMFHPSIFLNQLINIIIIHLRPDPLGNWNNLLVRRKDYFCWNFHFVLRLIYNSF